MKRLYKLEDVNLKHNPVRVNSKVYYQTISESCPMLKVLDDEDVDEKFFELKIVE